MFLLYIRYLLNFGEVTKYLGYNALLDYFPTMSLKPNETCADQFCVKRQNEFKLLKEQTGSDLKETPISEIVYEDLHPDNEYSIFSKLYFMLIMSCHLIIGKVSFHSFQQTF
jgi:ubiquitin-like modifier-activating enzyme 5